MISLNELWGHNVLDFRIAMEGATICTHYDVDDGFFVLMCLAPDNVDWTDLKTYPIDGIFRGVLIN